MLLIHIFKRKSLIGRPFFKYVERNLVQNEIFIIFYSGGCCDMNVVVRMKNYISLKTP